MGLVFGWCVYGLRNCFEFICVVEEEGFCYFFGCVCYDEGVVWKDFEVFVGGWVGGFFVNDCDYGDVGQVLVGYVVQWLFCDVCVVVDVELVD